MKESNSVSWPSESDSCFVEQELYGMCMKRSVHAASMLFIAPFLMILRGLDGCLELEEEGRTHAVCLYRRFS